MNRVHLSMKIITGYLVHVHNLKVVETVIRRIGGYAVKQRRIQIRVCSSSHRSSSGE
ncbi:hypothetical protein LguiA_014982 [Lonicera macranthoides]